MSFALGEPVPTGPVVIRPSELARLRFEKGQAQSTIPAQRPTASTGGFKELAQDVAKRLASGTGFPHQL